MSLFTNNRMLSISCCLACVFSLALGNVCSANGTITASEDGEKATVTLEMALPTATPISTPPIVTPSPEPTSTPTSELNTNTKKKVVKKTKKYLYSTGYVKVRKRATKKSSQKFLLQSGQRVEVLKESKKWVKVHTKNKQGYVQKKFLVSTKKKAKQIAKNKTESFKLTGYYGDGITKSGRKPRLNHTIAADLSVLPMYTEVYIEGMGTYKVEDIGGKVNGKHIDVFCSSRSQCFNITRRAKVIEIEG